MGNWFLRGRNKLFLLREQDKYIEDNGFTARVVAALPCRRRAWLRPVLLLGAVAIGSVLAVLWLP
jgi:hypothetical protein